MKRANAGTNLIQVELDKTIIDKNAFLSQKKEVFSLKEVISRLPSNLTRDELNDLHRKLGNEISERTSIICEMIPDDIWKKVFQLAAYKNDISKVFPLKQVSKRWESCFPSAIDEVTIRKSASLKQIENLKSIRSLTIMTEVNITNDLFTQVFLNLNRLTLSNENIKSTVPPHSIHQMTNLTALDLTNCTFSADRNLINDSNLTSLVNLEYLKFWKLSCIPFESLKKLVKLKEIDTSFCRYSKEALEVVFGSNLNIIHILKNLRVFTIFRSLDNDFININQLQKRYPHVRFRWYIENEGLSRGNYEGSFSEDNEMSGKGKLSFDNGDTYEGEFKNDKMEGKGVYYSRNLSRYEGDFKNGMREGKGILTISNGESYKGDFKNDKLDGQGVYTWPDGQHYEGQLKNDESEGKGVMYWSDGDRFEGEFKNDVCYLGIMYYSDGSRYAGEVNDEYREGKGIMMYPNGNRYEGKFNDDEREGAGVFYYSNGEKVEGDESKFILNEEDGTIVLKLPSSS